MSDKDNTIATAQNVTLSSNALVWSDAIEGSGDTDYYKFILHASSFFKLTLDGSPNLKFKLLDSNGLDVELNDGYSDKHITELLLDGTYYIRMYSEKSEKTDYTLILSAEDFMDYVKNNLKTAQPILLTEDQNTWQGTTIRSDIDHIYKFELTHDSVVELALDNLSANLDLILLDSKGLFINYSSNLQESPEYIGVKLPKGKYFVRIDSFGRESDYSLHVNASVNSGGTFKGGVFNDTLKGSILDDMLDADKGNDTLIGSVGNDEMIGGKGMDIYVYEAEKFNTKDLLAGDNDVINDGKGSRIDFVKGIERILKINDVRLSELDKKTAVGTDINANNNIAFLNGSIQDRLRIDLDNDGKFDPVNDFQIEIIGNANKLTFDAKLDMFVLG